MSAIPGWPGNYIMTWGLLQSSTLKRAAGGQAQDHPEILAVLETCYLKCAVLKLVE
jgi:hypothetical protein